MHLSPARQRLAIVAVLLLWCTTLLTYRIYISPDMLSVGLWWNLFLAVVPLMCSSALKAAHENKRPFLAALYFVVWLLFFPNAPYILTDLVHYRIIPGVPSWFLLAMLLSCAGAGTLFGYLSLIDVHAVAQRKFGVTIGWIVICGALILCGFGIYIGRFLRWNSWNAFNRPLELLREVMGQFVDAGPHPNPLAVTLVYGVGLIIGYLALRVIAVAIRES
jgi:uncharacterized membrane protein